MFTARYELNRHTYYRCQAFRHQSLNAATRVRSQDSPYTFYDKQSGIGPNFPPSTSVFPGLYHSTNIPYSSSSACFSYLKEKCAKNANLPKKEICLENLGALDRKVLSCFVSLRRDSGFCKRKLGLPGCQFKLGISLHSATILITHDTRFPFKFIQFFTHFSLAYTLLPCCLFINRQYVTACHLQSQMSDLNSLLFAGAFSE